MIEFKCSCGVELRVPDSFAGKVVTCNQCKRPNIQLPKAGQRIDLSEVFADNEETIMAEPPPRSSGRKRDIASRPPRGSRRGASSQEDAESPRRSKRRPEPVAPPVEIEIEDLEDEVVEEERPSRSGRGSRKSSRDAERPSAGPSKKTRPAPEPVEEEIEEEAEVDEPVAEDSGRRRSRGGKGNKSRSRRPTKEESGEEAVAEDSGRRGRKGRKNSDDEPEQKARGRSMLNTGNRSSRRSGSSKGKDRNDAPKNNKMILIIAAIVVLIGGGGGLYFYMQQDKAKPVAKAVANNAVAPTEGAASEEAAVVKNAPVAIDLNNFDYNGVVTEGTKVVELFGLDEAEKTKLLAAFEARKKICFEKKSSTEEYNAVINNIIKNKLFFVLCINDIYGKIDLGDTILGKEVLCGVLKVACAAELPLEKLKKGFPVVAQDALPKWDEEEIKSYIETMKTLLSNELGERLESQEIDWQLIVNLVQLSNPTAE